MLFYCLATIVIYNLIDKYKQKLYFYPSLYMATTKNKIININNEHIIMTNNKSRNLYHIKANKRCLLISHGNAGNITNRDYLFEKLEKYDGDIYCYEYPGFGKCIGSISIENCIKEHIYWINTLSEKYDKIDLWGESIGGGIVIETLLKLNEIKYKHLIDKIGKIYLQSTFSSIYNIIKSLNPNLAKFYYLFMFDDLETSNNLCSKNYLSNFKSNELIILHSKNDEIIPFNESQINYNKCIENKINVKFIEIKGTHNNPIFNDIFV
jgi:esterase/lipase